MRESIGGTWLTGIVICFLALFAAFLTYAINYTKAFRVKDEMITLIEENEGYTTSSSQVNIEDRSLGDLENDTSTEAKIMYFIKEIGYNYPDDIDCETTEISGPGYCLQKHCIMDDNTNRVYYKVTSYISLTIPIINVVVKIPISGETTSLYFDRSGMDTSVLDDHCYNTTASVVVSE